MGYLESHTILSTSDNKKIKWKVFTKSNADLHLIGAASLDQAAIVFHDVDGISRK